MSPSLDSVRAVLEASPLLNAEDVYEYLYDMPVDEPPLWEGDDSVHAGPHGYSTTVDVMPDERILLSASVRQGASLYVPLKRTMKLGMRGKDVLALQRAVAKAGFRKWGVGFTGIFGPGLKADVKQLQARHGVEQTGNYGPVTHAYGKRYFDRYGAYLMNSVKVATPAGTKRQQIVAAAMFGYHHRYAIHYTQGSSRMYGVRHKIRIPKIPYYEDCSSFSTWAYWHAGMKDPNGLGYNGFGFTGTLANHGRRTTNPQPGDLALYGRYPHSHVTIYVGSGRCVSHGSETGPLLLNVYYRPVNHFRTYF